MSPQTISPILEEALSAAAARDRALAQDRAERRENRITELRERAELLLRRILADDDDHVPDELLDLVDTSVESWEVDHGQHGQPRGLVGKLDGIPLGLLPNPERNYETVIVAARYGDVDGIRFLASSSPIRQLADLPDALEELEDVLAIEADAIRRQHAETADDRLETVEETLDEEELEAAIRRMDTGGLMRVADLNLDLAARTVAPLVIAAQLERIADHLRDRS